MSEVLSVVMTLGNDCGQGGSALDIRHYVFGVVTYVADYVHMRPVGASFDMTLT